MPKALRLVLMLVTLWFVQAAGAAEPVRVGATMSLTGKYAEVGLIQEKAYRLWEQDINRKGGLLGKPVRLTIQDDQSSPEQAKALYRKFIVNDKVDLVLAPYSSELTDAVSTVTEQYRYPLLASGGSADSIWQHGRKYVFGVYIPSSKYPVGFLELLVKTGLKKIAIVAADDVFSAGVALGGKEWARRYQMDTVYFGIFKKGSAEINDAIKAARAAEPEALIVAGHFDDAVHGKLALKELGWTPKAYYATVGPAIPKYAETLKDDADLAFSSSQWEPGLPFPGAREFAQSFMQTYKFEPSYHAASAYAAGQILEAAIRKANTLDRSKLRDTLSTLDTITVIGRYGVDRDGRQVRHFTSTVQWQKGKKEIVAPHELMTAKPVWK